MMVLEGGQRRRGPGGPGWGRAWPTRSARRGRRSLLSLLGLVVLVAVLLGLLDGKTTGPTRVALRPGKRPPPRSAPVLRSQYGTLMVPASERVEIGFKRGLRSGLLFDVRTGEVLWQRNPDQVLAIASLTKMMTAMLVLSHSRPSDRVLITPQALRYTGSGIGLLPVHKRVPELALLYGLLLPSGNDAAIALAQHAAGTQQRLIAMMNARARRLGLSCTHFSSVSGIVDRGNHSCASDLALITHELLKQPLLARIVGTRSATLPFPIKTGKLYLFNNNPLMIEGYPGIDGVKTGYTNASGQCLVATARRGRGWLGIVLLHSGDEIDQAKRLLNAGFAKMKGSG